jgi:hypothetical protein
MDVPGIKGVGGVLAFPESWKGRWNGERGVEGVVGVVADDKDGDRGVTDVALAAFLGGMRSGFKEVAAVGAFPLLSVVFVVIVVAVVKDVESVVVASDSEEEERVEYDDDVALDEPPDPTMSSDSRIAL